MYQFLYVLTASLAFLIDVVLFIMFVSAVLSWIIQDDEYPLVNAIHAVADLFTIPVRYVCDRFGWFQGFPIDMPFFITVILLSIISGFLVL